MKNSYLKASSLAGSALRALALVSVSAGATVLAAAPAVAQDYTNINASGRVTGPNGQNIAGATVTVVSEAQGSSRTVTTNSSGAYRVTQIPPGSYTFTVSAPGYDTYSERGVVLDQSGAANNFALVPEGQAVSDAGDVIVVQGTRTAVVDFDQTTTGAVINVAEISDRIPVARDLTSIIRLAPGTDQGDSAFGNLASAVGSSVSENVFYINGLNITDFRQGLGAATVPYDFYESVEVKNGGYQAEFGRATGAFVNATTKSGSNEFHGSVKFNWEPDDLRSDSPNTLFRDNDFASVENTDMIAQLSGPIIKDHLFFYGLYNARDRRSQFATTTPNFDGSGNLTSVSPIAVFQDSTTNPFYAGKLDAVIVDGQRLEFTYFNTSGESLRRIFNYSDLDSNTIGSLSGTSVNQYGGENYVGRYTGNITDFLTISAAYGKNKARDNTLPSDIVTPFISDQRFGTSTPLGNQTNAIQTQEDEREFYRADADVYFELLGSHHVKFGYDREDLTSVNTTTYTGGVAYTYVRAPASNSYGLPAGTDYVQARTFINGGTFESRNEAYYIQDNWSLFNDRLTLNLGLRNDRFENKNINGDVYYNSGDNFQPRLGFTFDVFGDARAKLYGSFGRYYLPIATNTNIRLGGAELDYDKLFLLNGLNPDNTPILGAAIPNADCPPGVSGNNCVLRNDGTVSPLDSVVAQNLENQSVDEYIVGYEQRIGQRWRLGLYGTYRNLNASLEDSAIDQGILNYCRDNNIVDCGGGNFFGAAQYALNNPGQPITITPVYALDGSFDPITLTPDQLGYPAARRDYKGVTFTFEREYDGTWFLQGSYTYSFNEGNIEGGVKSDNGQTDTGLATDFDFPSLTLGSFGYLPNDRRHNFKIYGSYSPFDWLSLGANMIVVSPRKFGCIGRVADSISSRDLIISGQSLDYGYAYGAEGKFCVVGGDGEIVTDPSVTNIDRSVVDRGSVFESDWNTSIDLDANIRVPSDWFEGSLRVSVLNVLNSASKLDFLEVGTSDSGTPAADYRSVTRYQAPRTVRIQLQVGF
ncbi:TonB-dependent receptor [Novosphingopyxis sp. YJ-S2-01]|uniref:TonB-dependent receptor n=1 Tax=Novosphingopyxis sp. YJ-S2-01 TaxID=2794021 RepID=UPI0018DB9746|nr:TonB-dependent receptor [Novosphingopyxis sp. YJ-S2-01]MBH9538877.1 TonB-dependent receptor [Novosphingopyxis sp. YJ-S2-01]